MVTVLGVKSLQVGTLGRFDGEMRFTGIKSFFEDRGILAGTSLDNYMALTFLESKVESLEFKGTLESTLKISPRNLLIFSINNQNERIEVSNGVNIFFSFGFDFFLYLEFW